MGVHGITQYLEERGLLPTTRIHNNSHTHIGDGGTNTSTSVTTSTLRSCCSSELWKEWSASSGLFVGSQSSNAFSLQQQQQLVPFQSRLLLDGNGLAFHLYRTAYAKYIQTIFPPVRVLTRTSTTTTSLQDNVFCCPTIKSLSQEKISQALPCMMPLEYVRQVTIDFATTLLELQNNVEVLCYWDGPSPSSRAANEEGDDDEDEEEDSMRLMMLKFKQSTLKRRMAKRRQEWAALQTYCRHGTLPLKRKDPICQCFAEFPSSKLFLSCVQQTLELIQIKNKKHDKRIQMVYCDEEADIALARAAAGDLNAFVLGQDSDFLFYKDIQYVPFGGLYLSSPSAAGIHGLFKQNQQGQGQGRQLYVTCLTRSKVATALGLDNEDPHMIELAILLGNDYIDPMKMIKLPNNTKDKKNKMLHSAADRIEYFHSQIAENESFQCQAKSKKFRPVLHFVRCLYNLQPFEYPIEDEDGEDDGEGGDEAEDDVVDMTKSSHDHGIDDDSTSKQLLKPKLGKETEVLTGQKEDILLAEEILEEYIISFPSDFPIDQAVVLPTDTSVQGAIVRCLEAYLRMIHNSEGTAVSVLEQVHLDAYQASTSLITSPISVPVASSNKNQNARPQWKDICAAYIIETCIVHAMSVSKRTSILARHTRFDTLIEHWNFHRLLSVLHSSETNKELQVESDNGPSEPTIVERPVLPIDEHQDRILEEIKNNQVTIIHGETGCGKSSRVPVMILEASSPEPTLPKVKMFISQPRRIAAASLVERVRSCEPKHRDKFAVRMGHGYREYESTKTQAWFVTTGYLTRLLANYPGRFDDVTHLIIDEVHERSVDTDILCLLCRRLLEQNKKIRLVLMSATLATKLYRDYFNVPSEPIHVGVRRFPIQEFFVEELHAKFTLPPKELEAAKAIQKECESRRCKSAPSSGELSKRFTLAARLTTIVGVPGSSVLIFVPGMNEIISITEAIEKFYQPGVAYICYPIHSDVPFEEQMGAFDAPGPDEVKVIIATNAAESSVTLPAVDHVICLGLCRQIMYNQASHRQILLPCWISKASATQRAGRTGRVRPGNVYRLYTRKAYEQYMDEFEQGEMVRIPLDSVILMLKEMLHEEVKPVLMDCIEPPKIETIDKSFESLHHWNFLTEPDDLAEITTLGAFVSALGIDLALGSFIGLGIQFGVAAEAIEMAAVMSFPKSPFQISNPLFHSPDQFNDIASKTYVSKCHFDANLYSESLAMMNALWDYHISPDRWQWCHHYRFAHSRMNQLYSTRNSLRKRVATFLGINDDKLQVQLPPVLMPHNKLMILRTLKVWVFSDTIVECRPTALPIAPDGSVSVKVRLETNKFPLSKEMLDQILIEGRHPCRIVESRNMEGRGEFDNGGADFSLDESIETIQSRLVSFMSEARIDAGILQDSEQTFIFFNKDFADRPNLANSVALGRSLGETGLLILKAEMDPNAKRRGVLERKCGLWKVTIVASVAKLPQAGSIKRNFYFRINHSSSGLDLKRLISQALQEGDISSMIGFEFQKTIKKKKRNMVQSFKYFSKGDCKEISKIDLQDLLAASDVVLSKCKVHVGQSLLFLPQKPGPYLINGKGIQLMATSTVTEESSWNHPLTEDIPEGVRLLSVLASAQRKGGHRLRFPNPESDDPEDSIDVSLVPEETRIGARWRTGAGRLVFVAEDTVPASATPTQFPLFACCSNALYINGGGMKVEGLTLLPPNPLYLLVSRLAFGLEPNINPAISSFGDAANNSTSNPVAKQAKALSWLKEKSETAESGALFSFNKYEATEKIRKAIEFHESCSTMGESLVCSPDKVKALCELLDGLVGDDTSISKDTLEKSLTPDSLLEWQKERKGVIETGASSRQAIQQLSGTKNSQAGKKASSKLVHSKSSSSSEKQANRNKRKGKKKKGEKKKENGKKFSTDGAAGMVSSNLQSSGTTTATTSIRPNVKSKLKCHILRHFDQAMLNKSRQLFATTVEGGMQLSPPNFSSTNILALVLEQFAIYLSQQDCTLMADAGAANANNSKSIVDPTSLKIDLESNYWVIFVIQESDDDGRIDGQRYYRAKFQMAENFVPLSPVLGRGKKYLPKWMNTRTRPSLVEDAKACVPPTFVPIPEAKVIHFPESDRPMLVFESLETALRMEAAFYLERQFALANKSQGIYRHWYDFELHEMVGILVNLWKERSAMVGKDKAVEL